jgi:hypothetical protein
LVFLQLLTIHSFPLDIIRKQVLFSSSRKKRLAPSLLKGQPPQCYRPLTVEPSSQSCTRRDPDNSSIEEGRHGNLLGDYGDKSIPKISKSPSPAKISSSKIMPTFDSGQRGPMSSNIRKILYGQLIKKSMLCEFTISLPRVTTKRNERRTRRKRPGSPDRKCIPQLLRLS